MIVRIAFAAISGVGNPWCGFMTDCRADFVNLGVNVVIMSAEIGIGCPKAVACAV